MVGGGNRAGKPDWPMRSSAIEGSSGALATVILKHIRISLPSVRLSMHNLPGLSAIRPRHAGQILHDVEPLSAGRVRRGASAEMRPNKRAAFRDRAAAGGKRRMEQVPDVDHLRPDPQRAPRCRLGPRPG